MTAHPTRDQLLDMTERLGFLGDRPDLCDELVDGLWAALDQAEAERDRWHSMWRQRGIKHLAAEKRATRAEARIAGEKRLRMKATAAATEAEARIQAVEDVLDQWQVDGYDALRRRIRRALDGDE